ncbi:AraC family transcriptional regulator [Gloeobacter kilaueensis]|uniref:AraC family transcriptional regulator n=1 Tax=Gloeobacter kilaueensis (strain ATCC BAA-2537 / CCAP 1431/1 / ULC 316 / JS1) TaxID=1183438 RepID=U5QL48_GLOK1|nr:AraC family transcriptional regulator [Gloeobacter kilaueensis]AGY59661.1 AraC family transcriptional regulator [Gloeobacter kilaueensis JS1]
MTTNLVNPIDLAKLLNKSPVLSSEQMGWNGILLQKYQHPSSAKEFDTPALSYHWLLLPLGHPYRLTQMRGGRLHESIVQSGDSIVVPAEQPSYWYCWRSDTFRPMLHIYLEPELIGQAAETLELDNSDQISLVHCFSKRDLRLQQIAMLLLDELQSGGVMGRLYVESLSQVLIVHLLRHYSNLTQTITDKHRSLTPTQLQQVIDYIHAHLNQDLSLPELARIINISPTYFASLFKGAMGTSPHQYVIQQRVEQAKWMLTKTDLAIPDVALQVGFSSQSHMTQQFKRLTGMTPKQLR